MVATKRATYADIEALPPNVVGELVSGVLHVSPRPASPHARATGGAHFDLYGPYDRGRGGPGGWWLLMEPELHFGQDVLIPDIAGWRRERMPQVPDTTAIELAPDWVCEALSPSTARFDRAEKMPLYARVGVRHLWLIDARLRTLEVYRLGDGLWTQVVTLADKARARVEPFAEIELDLSLWWLDDAAGEPAP
jgi:Uma2 family endonuclease